MQSQPRPITPKSLPAAMSVALPSAQRVPLPRPAAAAKPPQILQSGHAPAQLSFRFTGF
jgi:hypothetical protein